MKSRGSKQVSLQIEQLSSPKFRKKTKKMSKMKERKKKKKIKAKLTSSQRRRFRWRLMIKRCRHQ